MEISEKNKEQYRFFCYNIRAFRRQHALSRKEMAELLHIDRRTLRLIERGKLRERIPIEIVFRSARLYGVKTNAQFLRLL